MSKLKELLQAIIGQVNNSIKKTPQTLTSEEQAQVKSNLGIAESTGGDWSQSDEKAPDYIKNRTHSRVPKQGSRVLRVNDPSEFVQEYEEDGVTKYRWTQESFEVTVSGQGITTPEYDWSTYTFYDKQIYAGCSYTEYQLVTVVFTGDPDRYADGRTDGYDYGIDIICSSFRLHRPEGYNKSWVFTPYVDPDMLGWSVGKFSATILDVKYTYNKLDVNYLPTVSGVLNSSSEKVVPTARAVQDAIDYAIENNVDYFNLKNTPAYNIPESYERAISPKRDDSEGRLEDGTTSPVIFDLSEIKLWPRVGSVYRVYFDGQYYTCTCCTDDLGGYIVIGDISYIGFSGDSNEPFCVVADGDLVKLYFDSEKEYNSGLFYVDLVHESQVKKLDEDLIPDSIARTSDIKEVFYVTMTDNGDGTYTSDKTVEDILSAHNSGYIVKCKINITQIGGMDFVLPVCAVQNNVVYYGGSSSLFTISVAQLPDNTARVEVQQLSTTDDTLITDAEIDALQSKLDGGIIDE